MNSGNSMAVAVAISAAVFVLRLLWALWALLLVVVVAFSMVHSIAAAPATATILGACLVRGCVVVLFKMLMQERA
jgi:hypothetical protein